MESLTDNVYPAEWPGFPNEIEEHERFKEFVLPVDALTVNEILDAERRSALDEAEGKIYDYEIEMQRPVPPLEIAGERVGWRQRAKRFMDRAGEALRDTSISAMVSVQAKSDQLRNYGKNEKRKTISGCVIGALAVGAAVYLNNKGVASPGISHDISQHLGDRLHDAKAAHHASHSVTVHDGQNPWTISRHHLIEQGNPHPTDVQIANYDKKMAHANPGVYTYGGDSSENIRTGTRLATP